MSKNCLIYETLNDVKTMDVKKTSDGFMHLKGVFGVCGVRNNNSRIYEQANYAKMVESMQERIKKAPIPGELEHPQTMNITLENISHRIDSISIDEQGVVSGEITLLDTPKGKIAQAIVEGGLPLFISSRAQGQVNPKNGVVTLENLATYDLVGSPGFSQAEMHLNENQVAESICESVYYIADKNDESEETNENNENIEDMEAKEILEKLDLLENRIADLESQNEELQNQLNEHQEIDIKRLADSIQKWIVEEYSPEVQNWIMEEYKEAASEDVMESVKDYVANDIAPKVQKWIVEEYSPEIEKWVVESYSPEVEKWCTTELANGVQKWITEEFAPEAKKEIVESCNENVNNIIAENKNTKLQSIQDTLSMLESMEPKAKPTYKRVDESAPKYIAEMPEDVRVKYDLASQEVKESIARRAKLYNFVNEGAVEAFWKNIDFNSVKPVNNIYEGLNNVEDENERAIRASFRNWKARH